jgi:hypothetical protein
LIGGTAYSAQERRDSFLGFLIGDTFAYVLPDGVSAGFSEAGGHLRDGLPELCHVLEIVVGVRRFGRLVKAALELFPDGGLVPAAAVRCQH